MDHCPTEITEAIETLHYSTYFYPFLAPFPSLPPSPFLTCPVITVELTGESAAKRISRKINLGFEIPLLFRGMSTWKVDHSHFQDHVTHFTCARMFLLTALELTLKLTDGLVFSYLLRVSLLLSLSLRTVSLVIECGHRNVVD